VTGEVRAGGGLVWRRVEGRLEVLLVHRPAYDDWSFPKGKLETGESEPEAALREVGEETGLRCLLGRELPPTSYVDAQGRPKTVRYWAMAPVDGEATPRHEVDEVRWLTPDEASGAATYERDRRLVSALERSIAQAGASVRVRLIRHAKAGNRARWEGSDAERPLTGSGRRQAEALARALAGEEIVAAVSSPYVRCVETLGPLAAARSLFLQECGALVEGADPIEALRVVGAAGQNGSAVLSTHGDVQQLLVEAVAASGARIEGDGFEKGSTWVLDVRDGLVVAARHVPPPS
jgi:8-oxo-dGTP diphosphatase